MNANTRILRVVSLRGESSQDESFETILRNAGHKVTVLTSTEPAFALVNSSWPDVVLFDPISQFGMSGSIHRLRSTFDGTIVAAGHIPDPTIPAMLEELGISKFAATASELLVILKNVPHRSDPGHSEYDLDDSVVSIESVEVEDSGAKERQFELVVGAPEPQMAQAEAVSSTKLSQHTDIPSKSRPRVKLPSLPKFKISLPMKRWHRTAIGTAVATAVIVAVAIPFFGDRPTNGSEAADINTAQAIPVVPNLLTKPLVPLTLDELSGENLPLEIAGIEDRAVTEKPALAFWGDTAPDALVTVNGEPIEVSEYGAFVVDYPLEDGANFIEVLASDFQGRTTRQSFTVVSLQ